VDDEKYATAAGAINFGFPVIADTDIPQILPSGICTYEHVVSGVAHRDLAARAAEVRGVKIHTVDIPIPVRHGPAFEGERVRREDLAIEFGGKFCMMARVEGNDRKSFFAVADSATGVDSFRFWDYPVVMPETAEPDVNVYDMRLVRHEDGYVYGLFCTERKDPGAARGLELELDPHASVLYRLSPRDGRA